jgi:nucleoid-associated protein YgaU
VAAPESKPAEEEPVKVSKHTTKVSSGKLGHYKVAKGDSLWRISGKSKIYNDSFKWPLVYKANKAIIEDPDLIYPKQKFEINQNFNEAEIEDAVSKAKETEAYQPHSEPRKSLPIKY